MYELKVSGTEHIDDHHGKVSRKRYANNESFYEVMDNLVTGARMSGWTGITVEYRCINEDEWKPVKSSKYR